MHIFRNSVLFMLILYLSYRLPLYKALALSLGIGIFFVVRELKTAPLESFLFAAFINLVPPVAYYFRKDFEHYRDLLRTDLETVKSSYEQLLQLDKLEVESNLEKEKRLQQVLSLYEISKDMSVCLNVEEIYNVFTQTLKKLFRFRVSRFILLEKPGEITDVYQIEIGAKLSKVAPDSFDREIVRIGVEAKRAISITAHSQKDEDFFRRLYILKDFETLVAVPLFSQGDIIGILYIENLPVIYFENFIILAGQFAIQFQKVLLYKKVQELAVTDSLTGLSTRRYFLERFSEEIRRSMRHKTNLSLLMLDLDHFKKKNDSYGHLVGDVILSEVARLVKSNLREIDIVGRYGGEEFAIVLVNTKLEDAVQVAERIRQNIASTTFKAYDEIVSTTVSIGISVFPDDGPREESLIEAADKALYKAKESGRNCVKTLH